MEISTLRDKLRRMTALRGWSVPQMTAIVPYVAIIVAGIAAVIALTDDYDSTFEAGATAVCLQLTNGLGKVTDDVCQVEVEDGVWRTPRVEIRPLRSLPEMPTPKKLK